MRKRTSPVNARKAILTKSLPATTLHSYRIKATDADANSITVSKEELEAAGYSRIEDQHLGAAQALCRRMEWTHTGSLVSGWLKPGQYVHCFSR